MYMYSCLYPEKSIKNENATQITVEITEINTRMPLFLIKIA